MDSESSSRGKFKKIHRLAKQLQFGETPRVIHGSGTPHSKKRNVNASERFKARAMDEVEPEVYADADDEPYVPAGADDYDVGQDAEDEDYCQDDDMIPVTTFRDKRGRYVRPEGAGKQPAKSSDDTSWVVKEPVRGGPSNPSVIPSFLGHVASTYFDGEFRPVMKMESKGRSLQLLISHYEEAGPEVKALIQATGLAHLPYTMYGHIDASLLSAFIERWQPDTNSFHLPFGEMTILLQDVWQILRIPVQGTAVAGRAGKMDLESYFMDIFGCDRATFRQQHVRNGGVFINNLWERYLTINDVETQAKVWVLIMLGSTLLVDKSGISVRAACIEEMQGGLVDMAEYSWASATLAYLYRQLGYATRGSCTRISGCLTLLQAWIYEHFPTFRTHGEPLRIADDRPRACMWSVGVTSRSEERLASFRAQLDRLRAHEVVWMPYGRRDMEDSLRQFYNGWVIYRCVIEPYMPGRCTRQIGYIQRVPAPIPTPLHAVRALKAYSYAVRFCPVAALDAWKTYPEGYALSVHMMKKVGNQPYATVPEYMEWYNEVSHPRLLPPDDAEGSEMRPPPRSSEYWVDQMCDLFNRSVQFVQPESTQQEFIEEYQNFQARWNSAE